jgi:hypothetical protein
VNPPNFPPTRLPKLLKVLSEMRNSPPPYSEATIDTYMKVLAKIDQAGVNLDNYESFLVKFNWII